MANGHGGKREGAGRLPGRATVFTAQQEETWRARIRAGGIISRMNKIALGKLDSVDPKDLAVQIAAGKVLLAKVLPDKQSMDVTSGGRSLDEILQAQLTGAPPPPSLGVVVVDGVEVIPSENHVGS
jgi:hypothetical protein